jgi:protein dithiol:quinone oxidoreductase
VFHYLKTISTRRFSWILLFACVIFFELCALFFQHIMNLAPCVMCIYERVSMLGIGAVALVGLIAPKQPIIRIVALVGWLVASYRGYLLATQHVQYQLDPSPFSTCDIFVQFPSWAPLNQWFPWMFEAYGDCSNVVWQLFSLSMPQWLVIIFAANILISVTFLIAQFIKR